jgi:hypothetical protein
MAEVGLCLYTLDYTLLYQSQQRLLFASQQDLFMKTKKRNVDGGKRH